MTHEDIAEKLLTPLWRGIDAGYKQKYSLTIWQQFEENIKSSAYTSDAAKFLSGITQRMGVTIYSEHLDDVTGIINAGEDRALLKMMRDDTTLLVLLVRVANEERREDLKQKKEAKQRGEQRPVMVA